MAFDPKPPLQGQTGCVTWSPILTPSTPVKRRMAVFRSNTDPDAVCGQTAFFRYPHALAQLERWSAARIRTTGRLDHLFAPCSTGPEPYSYAMLARMAAHPNHGAVNIHALDIRPEFVSYARRGFYPAFMTDNLPLSARRHFHAAHDGQARLRGAFRRMVSFGVHDLAATPLRTSYDSIFMCNLLQWLPDDKAWSVLENALPHLKPGGVLVLDSRSVSQKRELLFKSFSRHGLTGVDENWQPVSFKRRPMSKGPYRFSPAHMVTWPEYNDLFIAARPAV